MIKIKYVVSYTALLLLITSPTLYGFVISIFLWSLGIVLIVKESNFKEKVNVTTKYIVCISTALFLVYFLKQFFYCWIESSKVKMLAQTLHISNNVLIVVTGIVLFIISFESAKYVLVRLANYIKSYIEKDFLKRNLFCCLFSSIMTIVFSQWLIGVEMFSMGVINLIAGILIVFAVILFLYFASGKIFFSIVSGMSIFMVLSTVNAYVYSFRGSMLEPIDFLSLGTAANVANNYSLFPIPFSVVFVWCLFVLCIWIIYHYKIGVQYKVSKKGRMKILLLCCCCFGVVFGYTMNLQAQHWAKNGAMFNGYILDFVAKFKESLILEPEQYNVEQLQKLSYSYTDNDSEENSHPNIIVIMDEAFSDLSVYGETLSANEEILPYISSLKNNTISGYALSSVFGGNTANSEYEFLTGNSLAWLPMNVVPYQQYIKSDAYSMVSYLKRYGGYECIAMHPFLASGWNRPAVYLEFGFDEWYFLDAFPQKNRIRGYVSDQEMFEELIRIFEAKKEKPLFLFGVTMQNHGDYFYEGKDFSPTIFLKGYSRSYTDVEQYLSLIHETDKAVQYLIEYFNSVEEDVLIVFYGDHQPNVNEDFLKELNGSEIDTLDEQQEKYKIPFFIWANYDIEEQFVECTSLNYLSTYMYETAGIPLPYYNQFLNQLEEIVPAMNSQGYYSLENGCFVTYDKAVGKEKELLDTYEVLQYNNLFDLENRNESFFPLNNEP